MRGLAQNIEPAYGDYPDYTVPVIAVVAAEKFPPTQITNLLSEGLRMAPTALWVVGESDRGAGKHILTYLAGRNLLVLPYKTVSQFELPGCCSRVVVFHMEKSSKTSWFARMANLWPNIVIVEAA